jgi:O-antigen ligase
MEQTAVFVSDIDDGRAGRVSLIDVSLRAMACLVVLGTLPSAIRVGSISMLGYATVVCLGIAVIELTYTLNSTIKVFKHLFLWGMFFVWICLSLLVSGLAYPQPLLANIALILLLALSAINGWSQPARIYTLHTILRWSFIVNIGISVILLLSQALGDVAGPRGCAIVAVLGLAVTLSYWRVGHIWWLFASVALWLVILLTLSRTATICGALLFLLAVSRRRDGSFSKSKILIAAGVGATFFAILIVAFPQFEGRFFFGHSAADFAHGKAGLDTSGRAEMWQAVFDSWSSTPKNMLLGQGAGTSEDAASKGVPSMTHPHNDYLAVLHDYGLIGWLIFAVALVRLLYGRWKAWSKAGLEGAEYTFIHSSAFLMVVAFVIMMITDNPYDYFYAILPVAIVVGSSVGLEIRQEHFAQTAI